MGREEILRLWANVWLSPAVLPEESAGVDRVGFVRILTKSTLVLVTEVSRLVLPRLRRGV